LGFEIIGFFIFWFAPCARNILPANPMLAWLPVFTLENVHCLSDALGRYNPYDMLETHHVARTKAKLNPEFLLQVGALAVGGGVWLHCGGNAPIDFILVVRLDVQRYCLRFMDAKHTTVGNTPDAQDVIGKARENHAAIAAKMEAQVANAKIVDAFDEAHVLVLTNAAADRPNLLGPKQFHWRPWSDILFYPTV
jgi:hypothetical protein